VVTTPLEQRMQGVGGWLFVSQARELERLAQDQVVMEIGSYQGRSAVVMAEVAKKLICVEIAVQPALERNIKPWRHKVELHEMDSMDAVKLDWEPLGFLFVDGAHDYETVRSDCGFLKWVVVGGYVVFHDTHWKGVKQAVDEIMTDNPEWEKQPARGYGYMTAFRRIMPPRSAK